MPTPAFSIAPDPLPCPVAIEITDELPSEFDFASAFAPLVAQWRAAVPPRQAGSDNGREPVVYTPE